MCPCERPLASSIIHIEGKRFHPKLIHEQVIRIEVLGNFNVAKGFHLNSVGELVNYNETFKAQDPIVLAFAST